MMDTRKRKPKFKVGQIVALSNDNDFRRIVEFDGVTYRLDSSELRWRESELRALTRKEAGR